MTALDQEKQAVRLAGLAKPAPAPLPSKIREAL